MGPNKLKSKTEKVVNVMIVALVLLGTVVFSVTNQVSSGAELMPKIFMLFLGAIITVQVIPSLILLAKIVKGVATIGQKKQQTAKVDANNSSLK